MTDDIYEINDHIESGLNASQTLESYKRFVIYNRNITSSERKLINMGLTSIVDTLGIKPMPSIESYNSRWTNASVSLENVVTDFLNKIWEGIKAFFRKIIDWFKGLFGSEKSSSADDKIRQMNENAHNDALALKEKEWQEKHEAYLKRRAKERVFGDEENP